MRLALAQINPTVGDLAGNSALIRRFIDRAKYERADLVVFPELALCGYPPKDLLLAEGFVEACTAEAKSIGEKHSAGITVVFGCALPLDAAAKDARACGIANALLAFRDGVMVAYYDKRLLPTYDVFDEDRYFVPGTRPVVIDVPTGAGGGGRSWRVGLSICEDLWRGEDVGFSHRYANMPDPVAELCAMQPDGKPGAEIIVNPSASPFVLGKGKRHRELLRRHAQKNKIHVAAVNQVGGNDELIFDGHAAVFDPEGSLVAAGMGFAEDLAIVELPVDRQERSTGPIETEWAIIEESSSIIVAAPDPLLRMTGPELLFRALVLGVRDYLRKTGFTTAVLGLSGGIDSAVVAVLAAAAIGPSNVLGVGLPGPYSSEGSITDARDLAARLGTPFTLIPITPAYEALMHSLTRDFAGKAADVTEENLQSRCRGTVLMALSNKHGRILLTTGNKSELAVGYCTLYGDMNGGLAVISDVPKVQVYALAKWINAHWRELGIAGLNGPPIPDPSITKPPSAELRPNQTDQDSLPPYEILDEIVERYVEQRQHPSHILAETHFDAATIKRVVRLIDLAEYKRKQTAVGLKVTGLAFGSGRRVPIAQGWRPERSL